jgi:hypothetical protein
MAGLWPAGWNMGSGEAIDGLASRPIPAPLILTIALPPALQQAADALRNAHAAEAARHAPAHISLFRHLPGPQAAPIVNDVESLLRGLPAPSFNVRSPLWQEGMWMAPVSSPDADCLREDLAQRWHGLLAPGDIAPPRLHLSLKRGSRSEPPPPALAEGPWRSPGLLLWQYGKARWTPLVAFAFRR